MELKNVTFKSTILILPGLGNSGELHWQTKWQKQFNFQRIEQTNWDTPTCNDWIKKVDEKIASLNTSDIILVGHSLACSTIVFWAAQHKRKIKGALLVAPSDTEAPIYPPGTTGFAPMPLNRLPFPSITVTSNNDFYVTVDRAKEFANAWGSKLVDIGEAGHINIASGFGDWPAGLRLLKELDT